MLSDTLFVQEIPELLRLAATKIEEENPNAAIWILKKAADHLEQEITLSKEPELTG